MPANKATIQIVWGVALLLVGLGMFYRIPQVMPKIAKIEQFASIIFFVKFSLYFIGVILVGGGAKKIYSNVRVIFYR